MTNEPLVDVVVAALVEILPEHAGHVSLTAHLEDELGANSIDRADLVQLCLERLDLDVPMTEFARAHTLADVVAVLRRARG